MIEWLFAAALATQTPVPPEACLRDLTAEAEVAGVEVDVLEEVDCLTVWLYTPGVLNGLDLFGADRDRVFSRAASADIQAALEREPTDQRPKSLATNPFCACRDASELTVVMAGTNVRDDHTGVMVLHYTFGSLAGLDGQQMLERLTPDRVHQVVLRLVREEAGWRVDDVEDADGASFRVSLLP